MADLEWLDEYSGQSTDELLALEPQFRTDSLVLAFEEALQHKADQLGLEALSIPEQVVLAVENLEREVNNGGYTQLFLNASDDYAPISEVAAALKQIGRPEAAILTQKAIDALEVQGPLTADVIDDVMDEENASRNEKLEEYSQEYWEDIGDLADDLLRFINEHRAEVVLIGARRRGWIEKLIERLWMRLLT